MAELLILDDADAPIVGQLSLGPLGPGETSAAIELHVWWAQGLPAEAPQAEGALVALARAAGSAVPYESDSTRLQISGGIELRLLGGAWVTQAPGAQFPLPEIVADSFIAIEIRVTAPIGAGAAQDVEVLIEPHFLRSLGWSSDLLPGGVLTGLRDRRQSAIYSQGGLVVEQGTPGDTVDTPAAGWLYQGVPYYLPAGTFTPSSTDGQGAALGSGEGYVSALTLGAGAYAEVKGDKAALPLDDLDRPIVPDDQPVLAWIVRDDTAVIETAEITQGPGPGCWRATSSGLDLTIHPRGPGALVGGRLQRYRTPQLLTLAASSTSVVWLLTDGSLSAIVAGTPPADQLAIPLWQATTDATDVVDLVDLRRWIPEGRDILLGIDEAMATGAVRYAIVAEDAYVLPIDGEARVSVVDQPGTADSTDVDLEATAAGADTWGAVAGMSIAFDADPATATAVPVVTALSRGDILRAIVSAQTATSQPAAGAVAIRAR